MTNFTFSIDEELHKKMKSHPEVNWTEILRRAIIEHLMKIEEPTQISVKEFRDQLDSETLHKIDSLDINNEIAFYKKAKKLEMDRTKRSASITK
jgi:hypothetical protein